MNKRKAKWIAIPFIIMLMGIFFINILNRDKEVSISENRTLQQMPTIKDIKQGKFISKFENYFTDQFAFREELSNFYTNVKMALGANKIKSYYVLDNNWILPTPAKIISDKDLKATANQINELSKIGNDTNKQIFYASTPHKESMLSHLYPKYTNGLDNSLNNKNKFKEYINKDIVKFIDVDKYFLNKFSKSEMENLYFKTDHHWNGIGAFEGFKNIIEEMNIVDNVSWDKYTTTLFDKGYFLGSYNKNLNKIVKVDETIPYVHLKDKPKYKYFKYNGKTEKEVNEEDVIATRKNEDDILYGGAYMFGNACSILKIRNDNALCDKKIIIFRDSYQAPTSWLYADIFSEVQLVDPRYTETLGMSIDEIMRDSDADIAMFMFDNTDFKEMIDVMKEQRQKN